MEHVRKIILATDYSEWAHHAKTRAAMLSVELNADIIGLYAIQSTRAESRKSASSISETMTNAISLASFPAPKLQPATVSKDAGAQNCVHASRIEKPAAAIIENAIESSADLIVCAAQVPNLVAGLLANCDDNGINCECAIPVLYVNTEPKASYNEVFITRNFLDESRDAEQMARWIAPSANITFLHALRESEQQVALEDGVTRNAVDFRRLREIDNARRELDLFIEGLGQRRRLASQIIEHGNAVAETCKYAKKIGADLIVIETHRKSRRDEFLLRSLAQRLSSEARCDLLII